MQAKGWIDRRAQQSVAAELRHLAQTDLDAAFATFGALAEQATDFDYLTYATIIQFEWMYTEYSEPIIRFLSTNTERFPKMTLAFSFCLLEDDDFSKFSALALGAVVVLLRRAKDDPSFSFGFEYWAEHAIARSLALIVRQPEPTELQKLVESVRTLSGDTALVLALRAAIDQFMSADPASSPIQFNLGSKDRDQRA